MIGESEPDPIKDISEGDLRALVAKHGAIKAVTLPAERGGGVLYRLGDAYTVPAALVLKFDLWKPLSAAPPAADPEKKSAARQ
jgi:hypothetical protein